MPPKTLAKVALLLTVVALLGFFWSVWWLNSRIFTPVDMPVSLEPGTIKTPPFTINLREDYWVSIDLDYSQDDYLPGRCNDRNLPPASWRVYRFIDRKRNARELWANDESGTIYYFWNGFRALPGMYQLE